MVPGPGCPVVVDGAVGMDGPGVRVEGGDEGGGAVDGGGAPLWARAGSCIRAATAATAITTPKLICRGIATSLLSTFIMSRTADAICWNYATISHVQEDHS